MTTGPTRPLTPSCPPVSYDNRPYSPTGTPSCPPVSYDNKAGEMGIELTLALGIFGEPSFEFFLPTPLRRRDRRLSNDGTGPRMIGEDMPDWPHPDDMRLNATRRRALSSSCGASPSNPFSIKELVKKLTDLFGEFKSMAQKLAPIDYELEFHTNLVILELSGYLRFQLTRAPEIILTLRASVMFLGLNITGDCKLSTSGGVVYGMLEMSGTVPKLCPICPTMTGLVRAKKEPPEKGNHVSVRMELDMEMACFVVSGYAELTTAGGLGSFSLEANNPMCLVDSLIEVLGKIIPGGEGLIGSLGDSFVSVSRVKIFYGGLGSPLTFELDLNLMGQKKRLVLKGGAIESFEDLKNLIFDNAIVMLDALDDVFNVFSLTFLDVTLGHPELNWNAKYGNSNWLSTGKGIEASGGLQIKVASRHGTENVALPSLSHSRSLSSSLSFSCCPSHSPSPFESSRPPLSELRLGSHWLLRWRLRSRHGQLGQRRRQPDGQPFRALLRSALDQARRHLQEPDRGRPRQHAQRRPRGPRPQGFPRIAHVGQRRQGQHRRGRHLEERGVRPPRQDVRPLDAGSF